MREQILKTLSPIRLRQRLQRAFAWGLTGLGLSAAVCTVLGILRLAASMSISLPSVIALLTAGPLLGALLGAFWKHSWSDSAAAVDQHYRLKDRTVTALEFAVSAEPTPFHELQLEDAARHVSGIDARVVAPYRVPRQTAYAAAAVALALTLLLYPLPVEPVQASVSQPAGIAAAAQVIDEDLTELEQYSEETETAEIEELVEELREELEELANPETDVREALATISEMQARLAAEKAEYNDALVDAQLQSVGAAMAGAAALQNAAEKLQEGDFDSAAEELEKLKRAELDPREARATSDRLAKVSRSLQQAGLSQMSEAVSQMSEAARSQDSKKLGEACNRLGQGVRQHGLRKRLNQLLQSKLNTLNECKTLCKANGQCEKCGGLCPDGQCLSSGMSLAGLKPKESQQPSRKAGSATAGNTDGERTDLDSQQNVAAISGQLSESGSSEFETTTSPEGREQARRRARQSFAEYQKMSEAVLESEPIPLGQRQTIRRYFQLIRPAGPSAEGDAGQTGAGGQDAGR